MDNQTPRATNQSRLLLPLLVTSVLLSLATLILVICLMQKSADLASQEEIVDIVSAEDVEIPTTDDASNGTYRSTFKYGNLTFSIPDGAEAIQTDSGGKSAVAVYRDADSVFQGDGIIYSVIIYASSEFETGESYSFEEWLIRQEVTITGKSKMIGGLQFYEGSGGDMEGAAHYHYVAEKNGEPAYVYILPRVDGDEAAEFIQDSLDFSPSSQELDDAQPVG